MRARRSSEEAQPDVAAKHPWYRDLPPDVYDLPSASITDLEKMNMPGEQRPLDTVYGFGNARGSVAFAELLLNVSLESAQLDEYVLASEIGFRGVAPGSAEIALWLPGCIGYDCFVGLDENP